MIDRSDAVNLARDWTTRPQVDMTTKGIFCLAEAVLRMDEYIRSGEAMERDAARYRWLRVHSTNPVEPWSTHPNPESLDTSLDEAIDAAMQSGDEERK